MCHVYHLQIQYLFIVIPNPKYSKHLLEEDHFYMVYMSQTYLNLRTPIYSTQTLLHIGI